MAELLIRPLAIDDADQIVSPNSLLTLINLSAEQGSVLLLGGHKPPQDWQSQPPDLVSRLTAMTTIQLPSLSNDESFRKRLRAACLRRYIRIPEETLSFVEPRLERSYQAIEAPHDQVHQCAQAVVNAVQTNNRPLAQQKLAEMEQYNREVNEHIQTMSENLLEEV